VSSPFRACELARPAQAATAPVHCCIRRGASTGGATGWCPTGWEFQAGQEGAPSATIRLRLPARRREPGYQRAASRPLPSHESSPGCR
jgi:hypothetical protein